MNVIHQLKYWFRPGLVLAAAASVSAQTTVIDENFDGGYVGALSLGHFSGGSPTALTNAVVATGGNPNGAWQVTVVTATSGDYYGGQVQLESVTGNTDTNPADYTVSFDAKGSQAAQFGLQIQTWPGTYFGGSGPVVNINTTEKLNAANSWQTFAVPLGSFTHASPTGATWQFGFQINASQWGGSGHTDTLVIDNIILKNKVVLPALALVSSANPSLSGSAITLTATVTTNSVPVAGATGSVVFSAAAGPFSTNAVGGGSATSLAITNLPVGANAITAVYAGNLPGATNTLTQLVSTLTTGQCAVDWNTVHQRIDGFGASSAFSTAPWTAAEADLFFSTNHGIGLSLLRTEIQPPAASGGAAYASATEIGLMQLARARGASIWGAPWSPPTFCKDNGSLDSGDFSGYGNNGASLLYASELAGYVAGMQNTYQIPIYAVSIQNEPDQATSYASCLWNGQQFHDFVTNLFAAFAASNVASTKIMLPEESRWDSAYYTAAMNDPLVAADVDILAAHNYDGPNFNTGATTTPAALPNYGKSLWETEVSTGDAYDGGITNALYWATRVHLFLTAAQANAWHYWWLISQNTDNEGLTDNNGNPAKRLFTLGNFSRFVRPGYYRIDATTDTDSGAQVSAYQETNSGTLAIVAVNTNTTLAINQTFTLTNATLVGPSVTPWITSISENATNAQAVVPVANSSFSYTLPALSVVTFVGHVLGSAPPPLAISLTGTQAVVSWNPSANGWTLQTNTSLSAGTWGNYQGPVVNNSATHPLPANTLFFRLQH